MNSSEMNTLPNIQTNNTASAVHAAVTVDMTKTLCDDILGLGVQWDPQDEGLPQFTPTQWEMIQKRIDFMETKFARVMMGSPFLGVDENGSPIYNWESQGMRSLYQILDYCENKDVQVMIGEWNKPRFMASYDDPNWIRAIADTLQHLHYIKGYNCLKFYNFVNEPNGDWMIKRDNWNQWSKGVTALYEELKSRGFLEWIKICGPDSAYGDDWVDKVVGEMPQIMGQYEYHIYVDHNDEIINNHIENRVRSKRDLINRKDPDGTNKYLWLGELGCKDGADFEHDCQNKVYDFTYGVLMADAVTQVFRGGLSGVIPWDLDDAMHWGGGNSYLTGGLKRWGFWNTLGGQTVYGKESSTTYPASDTDLRPWYYTMSLFSKLFPQGGAILDVNSSGVSSIKVTAMKKQNDARSHLSFAIVNDQDAAAAVHIAVPGYKQEVNLKKYVYFEKDHPVDEDNFPVPKENINGVVLDEGIEVVLPSRGVVFLTTL